MRPSPIRPRTLLRQRESPEFGYTFTHLWNIDFRRRTASGRADKEIIHIFVVGETYPRVVRVKATRDCTAARQIDPRGQQAREAKGAN